MTINAENKTSGAKAHELVSGWQARRLGSGRKMGVIEHIRMHRKAGTEVSAVGLTCQVVVPSLERGVQIIQDHDFHLSCSSYLAKACGKGNKMLRGAWALDLRKAVLAKTNAAAQNTFGQHGGQGDAGIGIAGITYLLSNR